jgi:hypothetical protein
MNSLFENILAARRSPGVDTWMPFIIVAVIIVFNVVRAIVSYLKSASEKTNADRNERRPVPPAKFRKAGRDTSSDKNYKTLEQLRAERIAQIRSAFGIPTPPNERKLVSPPARPVQPPPPVPLPPLRQQFVKKQAPQYKHSRPVVLHDKNYDKTSEDTNVVKTGQQTASHHSQANAGKVFDFFFHSQQDLQKAILYQEILGKPLALRD